MKIPRVVKYYSFPQPPRMSEVEFQAAKQRLPVQPYMNIWGEFFKENGAGLAVRLFLPLFPTGSVSSAYNHYELLTKKKKFFKELFEAINSSETYKQYCEKYDTLIQEYRKYFTIIHKPYPW